MIQLYKADFIQTIWSLSMFWHYMYLSNVLTFVLLTSLVFIESENWCFVDLSKENVSFLHIFYIVVYTTIPTSISIEQLFILMGYAPVCMYMYF